MYSALYPSRTVAALIFATVASLFGPPSIVAADEDEDFPPGLEARYTVGESSVRRIDNQLSFDWGGAAPDERLPTGPFTATWSGNLLARLPGSHRFHAFVAGDVELKIDGRLVLQASSAYGFNSGEPFDLTAGDHAIEVRYSTPAESDKPRARLNVFWSSDAFTMEPLPADVLFRDEGSSQLHATQQGRLLSDAFRCAACHRSNDDQSNQTQPNGLAVMNAPALDRVKGSQDPIMLIQRLMLPQKAVSNSHMPGFGLSAEKASSVADFLLSVSKDAHKESEIKFKEGDVDAGARLLHSLGCVACHQLPGGQAGSESLAAPYDAPELVNVAKRRSVAWLDRWLRDPESLNVDHRMPVYDLSKDERRQLVATLAQTGGSAGSWASPATTEPLEQRIAAGKKIVAEANCAACHRIPGMKATNVAALVASSSSGSSSTNGKTHDCIRKPARTATLQNGRRVPHYAAFSGKETVPLTEWIRSTATTSHLSIADRGHQLLQRNGCTACHDRDLSRGLSNIANRLEKAHPELAGQSQGLIPPSLTAVGDKLNDDYLRKAVAGEQVDRRLPWLLVRMPKFKHSEADRSTLVHHLVSSDRMPDEADAARQDLLAEVDLTGTAVASTEDLLLGNQLTGAAGFNCVACHKAGPFEPRNVALGTRGSDIMTMGSRIRPRFFQRWMKNPIRVIAGIEMPAIKKAMPDVLDGSLPKQIGVIWTALSDSRFTPPTVTSRFEQIVNVEPGGSPRIIRDVFTMGTDKDREAVARAMAIGFGNGHNLLIDLDTMSVRLWTIGEFARQRTEGKSWYWDMPGIPVQRNTAAKIPLTLTLKSETLLPIEDEGRFAELLSYRQDGDAVEITCAWRFASTVDSQPTPDPEPHFSPTIWERTATIAHRVVVKHRFEPTEVTDNPSGIGWKHGLTVLDAPAESEVTGWLSIYRDDKPSHPSSIPVLTGPNRWAKVPLGGTADVSLTIGESIPVVPPSTKKPVSVATMETITTTPGFVGTRLPIDSSIMPTSMAWLPDGRMVFTSLKGQVWIAEDTNNDGLVDSTSLFEEGLAAPFGILTDADSIIVAHKPEVLRLRDTDGDGRADEREVIASGWGYNDNYHDWTSGLVRDKEGNMYVGLGSDYSQKDRPTNQDRWRGGVIKIDPSGIITPLGMSMRYPMSLAFDNKGNLFATDNQGVQNTFNEINHILPGKHYGVPSAHQPTDGLQHEAPALMVPHPLTRSVNSILFLPDTFSVKELRGHGIGCEYDSRFLMRFTIQNVGGILQGASYRFSLPEQEAGRSNFIGPICSAVSPKGELYIGSIWDSGWQGGLNTGGITKLVPDTGPTNGDRPNGIQELTATPTGFEVTFFRPVDPAAATDSASWSIQGYTREWGGSYATPDSGRYSPTVSSIKALDGGKTIRITASELKPGHVYDISTTGKLTSTEKLWPSEAHYSMKVVPK